MQLTTLCYIEKDDAYLMLHRTKKENDINKDKWIGVGGHFLPGETPEECLLREVKEETGLTLLSYRLRGIITFGTIEDGVLSNNEYMHLFTADEFEGSLKTCDEGELVWIQKETIPSLPLWEGDHFFLDLLSDNAPFFSMKLFYENDHLIENSVLFYE